MKHDAMIKHILQNAAEMNMLQHAIAETFKNRAKDEKAWQQATERFHQSYDRLAFPGGLERGMELLNKEDPSTIDVVITYLEANPYCFRSGYIKEIFAKKLKNISLTNEQKLRLQKMLIASVPDKDMRTFKLYCILAASISDDAFRHSLDIQISQATDTEVKKRLCYMRDIITRT